MEAILVVDLGFGDAGKGSLVDYYVRRHRAHTVVRFNGGAQAAHNVVTPDGRHHTFSQFGSGTFVPGVRTHLSRFMLVDPVALLLEERHLRSVGVSDAFERLSVSRDALVVTPFQRAANRLREMSRGRDRHGSCGMGIGETMADMLAGETLALRMRELLSPAGMYERLRHIQHAKRLQCAFLNRPDDPVADREWALLCNPEAPAEFADLFQHVSRRLTIVPDAADMLHAPGAVVFEGAQGVLLDEWYGFHPHTTWSTTTFGNALTLLHEADYPGGITRIGSLRAYMTRHGPGPFPTEDADLTRRSPDLHNALNPWQRQFRIGWLDLLLLRYALEVAGGVDQLAVTCLDRMAEHPAWRICRRYHGPLNAGAFHGDRLRVAPASNLAHQERLTSALAACMPDYQTVTGEEPLLNWIENSLDRPVTLASRGLTWQHKHMRQNRYRRSTTTSPSTSFCASVRSAVRSSETSV